MANVKSSLTKEDTNILTKNSNNESGILNPSIDRNSISFAALISYLLS